MKIITWNCNMAFRKKKENVLAYDPDIIIIQECENPRRKGSWDEFTDYLWIGENPHKGLGIFVRNGYSFSVVVTEEPCSSRYIKLVRVGNRLESFLLMGLWAMDEPKRPRQRYIGQVYSAVKHYYDLICAEPCIIAGDFNGNAIWDAEPNRPLCGNFAATVQMLADAELFSVYHHWTGNSFGKEEEATLFLLKQKQRPYHIDYLFVPVKMKNRLNDFWVGSYEEWIALSDHMPLFVDFSDR